MPTASTDSTKPCPSDPTLLGLPALRSRASSELGSANATSEPTRSHPRGRFWTPCKPFGGPADETARALRYLQGLANPDAEYPDPVAAKFLELFGPKSPASDGGTDTDTDTDKTASQTPLSMRVLPSAIQHQMDAGITRYTFNEGDWYADFRGTGVLLPDLNCMWLDDRPDASSSGATRMRLVSAGNRAPISHIATNEISTTSPYDACEFVHLDPWTTGKNPDLSEMVIITAKIPKESTEGQRGVRDLFPGGTHLTCEEIETAQPMPDPAPNGRVPAYQYAKVWLEEGVVEEAGKLEEASLAKPRIYEPPGQREIICVYLR